nr:Heterokaryon incompatibility protein 6, OR allele 12 [Colletotrichum truncatum]KAF6799198.1 Heterokaryon incompatibility protein 6, OR allele 12 [Colletotrichum truncatum]
MILDDNLFAIIRSLNDARRDLPDATREWRIWAEAPCIHQEEIPKEAPIRDTCSTAHNTILCVGSLTDGAAKSFPAH